GEYGKGRTDPPNSRTGSDAHIVRAPHRGCETTSAGRVTNRGRRRRASARAGSVSAVLLGEREEDGEIEGFVAARDGDEAIALAHQRAAHEFAELFGASSRRVVDGADQVAFGESAVAERRLGFDAGDDQP